MRAILLGFLAIASPLFLTVWAGMIDILSVKIVAFVSSLSVSLIGAFNLSAKASNVRNGWKHLNKAVISFKAKTIEAAELIQAYEDSENMLGSIEFNFNKSKEEIKSGK